MSTPPPWPSPSGQPTPPAQQQAYGSGPHFVPAPGQQVGYQQHGGPLLPPVPPKPEGPLLPGVWWSLAYNAIVTALWVLALALLGAFIWTLVTGVSGEQFSWGEVFGDQGGTLVLIVVVAVLAGLLVQWGLTVLCLVLWRLVRGFRTLHPALQALLALVSSWVVGTLLSFALQIVGAFAGVLEPGTSTY